jgi:adsorption protein B
MTLEAIDLAMRWLAWPVAGAICANQFDELFIDANYLLRGLHRRERRVVPEEALRRVEQKRVAVLLPAWQEAAVIEHMLEHNLAAIDYDPERYDVFCGTYRNDPDTQACVDRLARRFQRVHKVVVPHDGPTSKADCLNWIHQGIVLRERQRGIRYDILLMHDAEDVVHPLSLRLYSMLIPRYEFVQTPVFSLQLRPTQLVAGTYIDEFAEHHLKEMQVRQAIGGLVPSAGVGSAFERAAFQAIALAHRQQPFNPASLTEDYEIGLRFRLAGRRVCFACHTVERRKVVERGLLRRRTAVTREEYIATREYFPSSLAASVRQRSRWILGIALQAWEQVGWQGALPVLYCLWRDRKGLLNNLLVLLAYALAAWVVGRNIGAALTGERWDAGEVSPGLLALVLAFNAGAMAWRILVKVQFVRRLYGPAQGLLVLPRLAVANLIGFLATARAVRTYLRHRLTGQPLRWLKTAHAFPSADALSGRRRRLGELLVERGAVRAADVEAALSLQKRLALPLGELLAAWGVLPERDLLPLLAEHLEMRAHHPDPAAIPAALLRLLPEAEAERMNVLPVSREGDGAVVAAARPLPVDHRARLEQLLGSRVEPVLSTQRALRRARSVAYRSLLDLGPPRPRLGERLVERGSLDGRELASLLAEQLDGREMLGEMLLRKGLLPAGSLERALRPEGGFRHVGRGEGDPESVARLGYGHCALYALVPLRARFPDGRRVVASAFPAHAQEQAELAGRLGEPVAVVLAPMLQIRAALAAARGLLPGGARLGLEGLEVAALSRSGLHRRAVALLWSARAAGESPLGHLEKQGRIEAPAAARVRAEVLGLPLAPGAGPPGPAGALPPSLERGRAIRVREAGPGALVLAATRPSPRLALEVADLLPGWRIAWQVAEGGSPSEEVAIGRAA